jgi:hypothetical protein
VFDGDILNVIAVFEPELIRMLRKFEPMKKYIMNREDGSLNPLFNIAKGNLVNLNEFATFKNEDNLEELDEDKLMQYVNETKKKENRKVIYLPNGKIIEVNQEDLPPDERGKAI